MYCGKCGEEIPDGSKFCPKCGEPVGGGAQAGAASPVLPQDARPKGSPFRTLGILLCVFAALDWVFESFYTLYDSIYITIDLVITFLLVALLAVIGLKSVIEPTEGNAAKRYTGIADCLLAGVQLFGVPNLTSGIWNVFILLDLSIPNAAYSIFWVKIFLLIAAAGLYVFAILKKDTVEKRRGVLRSAGILFGVFALASVLLDLWEESLGSWNYYSLTAHIITISVLVLGSLYTAGLILRGVSLIPKKDRTAPQARATTFVSGGQAVLVPGDAPSMGFAVLGFFIPLVGLILYLVWKDQFPLKARSCGKGALIGVISQVAVSILCFILIFVLAMLVV